ncbi:hypothetical protein ECEC1864_5002 [Escherichia coli EC1864]|nr:hypothetical protein ECFRIK1997_6101 [Escherichia coli FRIK1997]EKJ07752.1 hypothetical protein ECEC1864_5002 [Escherichia coli EC1864]
MFPRDALMYLLKRNRSRNVSTQYPEHVTQNACSRMILTYK